MANALALRLHDKTTKQDVIVTDGQVYADKNGDGKIAKSEQISTPRKEALLTAAGYIDQYFVAKVPGTVSQDGSVVSNGSLTKVELKEFEGGGTPTRRNRLQEHLAFFDVNGDGKIAMGESFKSWRALGFSKLKSATLTAGSTVVFGGRPWNGMKVDLASMNDWRPKGTTGIYDKDGNIDQVKFDKFIGAFEKHADAQGVLSTEMAKAVVTEQANLGSVPKRQFDSFYAVCEYMNKSKTVTVDQVRWLYDGSLLYRAAGTPDNEGHAPLQNG